MLLNKKKTRCSQHCCRYVYFVVTCKCKCKYFIGNWIFWTFELCVCVCGVFKFKLLKVECAVLWTWFWLFVYKLALMAVGGDGFDGNVKRAFHLSPWRACIWMNCVPYIRPKRKWYVSSCLRFRFFFKSKECHCLPAIKWEAINLFVWVYFM